MSADNWRTCPGCEKDAAKKQAAAEKRLRSLYGNVPEDEYLREKQSLESAANSEPQDTMREDYEFYVDDSGKFNAVYRAFCRKCEKSFEFRHQSEFDMK